MNKKTINRVVKETPKKVKLLDKDSVEYVIYCRKSTEAEDRQAQSIADQMKVCLKYADSLWLKIMEKPAYFEKLFYTSEDQARESREKEKSTLELYKNTKNLFIIRESSSWKIAFWRKKWRELIRLINAWKIKWVLAYSPDRVSRNMAEWWEFIDLIDNNKVFPQFANFHYENNDSWKMMLWIYFALSKQYSDKLSTDINRWNQSTLEKWKSLWIHKAWYMIDEETGYYKPHPEYFSVIRKAFEKKIYENWTDAKIVDFVNWSWYKRIIKKTWKEVKLNDGHLYSMWTDEFYYWYNVVGWYVINLTELNTWYEPMISEAEFTILYNRYKSNNKNTSKLQKWQVTVKSENNDLMIIENGFMKNENWKWFTFGLPNKSRYLKKLEEERLKWNNFNLSDVVKDHQMEYSCSDKENNYYNSITVEELNKWITKILNRFKI